jgi:nicotinamide mononucleotide transporter
MGWLIEWLNGTAFHLLGADVSWAEVLGDLTGALCVWWAARENVWNWPIGNLNGALFLVLFVDAKLYADSILQVVFIVLGFYGWWQWTLGTGQLATELPVRRTTNQEWLLMVGAAVVAQACWTTWLAVHTDSPVPFWDASVLVLSLVAVWGQARKLIESWYVWIVVDVISVPLYISRELRPTAVLYAAFGGLCVVGWRTWRRSMLTEDVRLAKFPA